MRQVADGLVGIGQIDRAGDAQQQRVGAGAAVDRGFRSPIGDAVVTGAGIDDISATAAVDGVVAGTGRDRVGGGRADDRDPGGQRARVEILEILDERLSPVVWSEPADNREVDRCRAAGRDHHQGVDAAAAIDRGFGAVIGDRVVAAAGGDDVGAAAAVDGVVAGAAGQDVGAGRAGQRDADRQRRGVDILEIGNRRRIARSLIGDWRG